MRWTEEGDARLKQAWTVDGLSATQIAAELVSVSRNAVIGRIHRLGLIGKGHRIHGQRVAGERKTRLYVKPKPPKTKTFINAVAVAHNREKRKFDKPVVEKKRPNAPPPLLISLLDLERHHCRWPIGDPQAKDFGFCGHDRSGDGSYCDYHQRAAYI